MMNLELKNILGFDDFSINFSYPQKIVNSMIEHEHLSGRTGFRYKKAVILMGANATDKTSLGKVLSRIFKYINTVNTSILYELVPTRENGSFRIDFVNTGNLLHRLCVDIDSMKENIDFRYCRTEIEERDTYEKCAARISENASYAETSPGRLKN